MNDDTTSGGAPDPAADPAAPPPPAPDTTVMRPRDPDPVTGPAAGPAGGPATDEGAPVAGGPPAPPGPSSAYAAPPPPPAGGIGPGAPLPPAAGGHDVPAPVPADAGRTGLTGAVVPLGSGLLGAAVVISTWRSRSDGELDWSNYGVGLGATAVLLLIALLGSLVSRRREGGRAREDAVTWPAVVGILGTALMIDVGLDSDERWVDYLIGGVVVALAVIGYAAARRAALVVTAIVGLALVYALAYDDVFGDAIDDEHGIVVVAAGVAVFVLAVTVLGWLLPSRVVSGVAVGAAGVVAFAGLLGVLLVMRLIGEFFAGMGGLFATDGEMPGPGGMGGLPGMGGMGGLGMNAGVSDADVWWILALAGGLALLWALAASLSSQSGFALLAIAMPVVTAPLGAAVLAVEHPTWWSGVLAAAGGVLLLGGVLLSRGRARSASRTG